MTREEVLEIFLKEVKRLEDEEHVSDLMKAERIEELQQIQDIIDYSVINQFLIIENLDINEDEIEEKYLLAVVLYINGSGLQDSEFFLNYYGFLVKLEKEERNTLCKVISVRMKIKDLYDYSLEELLDTSVVEL